MGTIRPWYTIPLYDDDYDDCCLCRDVQEVGSTRRVEDVFENDY